MVFGALCVFFARRERPGDIAWRIFGLTAFSAVLPSFHAKIDEDVWVILAQRVYGMKQYVEIVAIFTENGVTLDTEKTTDKQCYTNEKLLSDFKTEPYKTILYFGFEDKSEQKSNSLQFLHEIASFFVEKLSKNPDIEITRTATDLTLEDANFFLQKKPYAIGSEFVDYLWILKLWNDLSQAFGDEISNFDGTVSQYILIHNSKINVSGRVFFHLVENKSDEHPFAFLATYSRKSGESNKAEHVPLKNALLEYKDNQELLLQLLSAVSRAADKSDFISELIESGELFSPLRFTTKDAYTFLKEIPLYEECGIMCRMPDWWKKKYSTLKLTVAMGEKAPPHVGLDALLSFAPQLSVDGVHITREELESLLSQTEGLSFLKGKWVEIDYEKLRTTLEAYDKADSLTKAGMTFAEAMRLQLGLDGQGGLPVDHAFEVSNGQWLESLLGRLKTPETLEGVPTGGDFRATLRPYQQNGLKWLATMKSLGFGALLADDMGLGKTVQVLALLEYLRQSGVKTLLIIPASLIGNWRSEIERFAPKLRYSVLHDKATAIEPDSADVFITTYGMTLRLDELKKHAWDLVILDEAQAIKNPGTKQTKAVKAISALARIAMTGTPVENRLSDLWSLFDCLNPGLLGTSKEFSGYAKKIQNSGSYSKLRSVVSPFILRRLKTDKSIINDLPEKMEVKVYAALAKKQIVLYSALVKELEDHLDSLDGIKRKGVVLASLMKFKQICNHPDQYLGQGAFDSKQSGKFQLLGEICETIHAKRERVLVFTQFREICGPLSNYLETVFGKNGLALHGGTPVKKRGEIVEKFNGDEYVPYMVLSPKAGGVGLNLTAANHVIHFDRWWNPAVENQATDRAFRIGQKKNVLVHKFISSGTIEEKIDDMIEDKMKLSGELIADSGENWITEMSSKDLMRLFSLEM